MTPSIKSKKNLIIIIVLIFAVFLLLALRIGYIQIVKGEEYSDFALTQQTRDIPIKAERGAIYDRNGQVLALSATAYTASVVFKSENYSDTQNVPIEKLGHAYELTGWNWNGYMSATATFTCAHDQSHVTTLTSSVSSQVTKPTCLSAGGVVYTATVEFEGKTYTDQQTDVLEPTGHK